MAAAYAVALQMLLGGVAFTHSGGDSFLDDPSVICLGNGGDAGSHDGSGAPDQRSHCPLCTLAKAPHAILPDGRWISTRDVEIVSTVAAPFDDRITDFKSPTGRFQRGPPSADCFVG